MGLLASVFLFCFVSFKQKSAQACLESAVCSNQSLENKSYCRNSPSNKFVHANRASEEFVQ